MTETAQQYLNKYNGQSLLYAPSPAREYLRGQCVQAICFFVTENGHPVDWADAYFWKNLASAYPNDYEWIPYTPGFVPQPNDIVIWLPSLPGSGGAGHIAAFITGNTSTFVSADQNWGGKTVHAVTHNYNYVAGVLRFTSAPAAPATTTQGGIEMIADTNQAHQAYQLLRVNGDGSPDEISATAGHRSWAQFASDAQPELAARNQAAKDKDVALANMQSLINTQNQTVSDLTQKLTDVTSTAQDKQAALTEALTKIASNNADLATQHDTIVELDKKVEAYSSNPIVKAQEKAAALTNTPSSIGKVLASILGAFGKFKSGKK